MGINCDVMIATPSYDGTFFFEMENALFAVMMLAKEYGLSTVRVRPMGSNIANNRNVAVTRAREMNAKWLFFVDSDTAIPPTSLKKLMAHDLDIVGGLYVGKQPDYVPIASRIDSDGGYIPISEFGESVETVDGIGAGCLLIKMEVFDKLTVPYFCFDDLNAPPDYQAMLRRNDWMRKRVGDYMRTANNKGQMSTVDDLLRLLVKMDEFANWKRILSEAVLGEDYYFCRKAQAAGFKIHLDPTVCCNHYGRYPYRVKDFLAYKKAKESVQEHEPKIEVVRA